MQDQNQIIIDRVLPAIQRFHPHLLALKLENVEAPNTLLATITEQMPDKVKPITWQYHVLYSQRAMHQPVLKGSLLCGELVYWLYV